jgi:hypothetical protein
VVSTKYGNNRGFVRPGHSRLIAVAILLVGQAIVSMRCSLESRCRGWAAALLGRLLILAAGYACSASAWCLHMKPIYSLLLSTIMMIAFTPC